VVGLDQIAPSVGTSVDPSLSMVFGLPRNRSLDESVVVRPIKSRYSSVAVLVTMRHGHGGQTRASTLTNEVC
jgi:hypothetical protein